MMQKGRETRVESFDVNYRRVTEVFATLLLQMLDFERFVSVRWFNEDIFYDLVLSNVNIN